MTEPSTTPGASLPDGWERTGFDEIGNADGYRISKSHVATATGVHPLYHAYGPAREFLVSSPDVAGAVSRCEAYEARRSAHIR